MKFIIMSRRLIEAAKPYGKPHLIISVKTPGDSDAKLPTNDMTLGVLRIACREIYNAPADDRYAEWINKCMQDGTAFTKDSANRLLEFVKPFVDKVEAIIVHCEAGLARSPAIAAGLANTIFFGQDNQFFGRSLLCKDIDTEELAPIEVLGWKRYCTCFEFILEAWNAESCW